MTHDELDVYGFLKHYRDGLSWNDPLLVAISTKDAMNILEKYWREKMADEIENFRVETCRCELTLKPNCEALSDAIEILKDTKHLANHTSSFSSTTTIKYDSI